MMCACCESDPPEVTEVVAATAAIKPESEMQETLQMAASVSAAKESNEVAPPNPEVETPKAEAQQAEAPAEAADPKKTFEVSVTNSDGNFMGLEFFAAGGELDYLLASEVKSGPLDLWNKAQEDKNTQLRWQWYTASRHRRGRQFDRIVAVNGEAGTADALKTKLGQKGDLKITVERPRLLQFKIERSSAAQDQSLGLPLKFWTGGPGLTIECIQASSIIGKYLEAADPAKRVRTGDHLVMLNGKRLNPTSQAEADDCAKELELPSATLMALVFRSYLA
eukprot:TRINITY_DN4189_c0_g1_i1.p1 TRINITY_DN4189_c0_g1~~TRINITY_DN4189_c0_g1_i1.p1  ORF type:complete len:279 (-),score=64.07 TRINITY_DN4189_c0_g1_i1:84-920(-)